MSQYYVYILASDPNGTLYIGVTSNIIQRTFQHKNNQVKGFTQKYNIHKLVFFESCSDIGTAITREKQLKKWNREWKVKLIEQVNPDWKDLYNEII